jgi:hypothetical protein
VADEVSPRVRSIGAEELIAHVVAVAAAEDPTPFFRLAPALRWTLHRSMSALTETFNITTADAVAEGVPCVTTPAIEWVPPYWQVESDRLEDVARVAGHLLSSADGAAEGLCALERYCEHASDAWLRYSDGDPARPCSAPS